jgi:DNA-binding NarL/FixJ family response regulator
MIDLTRIRILCVDDHPLFREGIAAVIAHQKDMQLVAMAATAKEAIDEFRQQQPDITLMDLRLPDMSGISAVASIRADFPEARIIMLTTFEGDVEVQRALLAGARGYLLKSTLLEELVEVIRKVHSGRKHLPTEVAQTLAEHFSSDSLTEREVQVLRQIAQGNRNRDIGECLSISEETVKVHIKHIMDKLGAKDRTQAVAIGIRRGVIHI